LAEVTDGDEFADVGLAQLPQARQHGQHIGDRKRIERVEEPAGADRNENLQMPCGQRQPFDASRDLVIHSRR